MTPLSAADLDDYRALITECGLVDVTQLRACVELTGDDRHAFLHNFCTNDIRNLAEGSGCEAMLLDAKGHVLFYVFVRRRPERLLVDLTAGRGEALVKHLDKYLIREKVKLRDLSSERSELVVAGPRSAEVLQTTLNCDLPEAAQASVAGPGEIVIVRSIWTPEPNFSLQGPTAAINEVGQKLIAPGVRSCGSGAFQSLRIEAGTPLDGIDLSEKNIAQELDRNERTLHFKKGCYLGQETVARLDALGHVNKRLIGVKFSTVDDAAPPEPGTTLAVGGQSVGQITSTAFSPRLGAWLALAYIRESATPAGTKLDTQCGPAEAATLPFVA